MTEKRVLLHIKHTWMDVFRFPIVIEVVAIVILIITYFTSNYQYGYFIKITSLSGLLFIAGIFLFAFVIFPGFVAYLGVRDLSHIDEWLWIEGDTLIYKHGKYEFKLKMKDIKEISLNYGSRLHPYFIIRLKKKYDGYNRINVGDSIDFRTWITEEEGSNKLVEMYNEIIKYNPKIVVTKWYPKVDKRMQIWDGKEWKPIAVSELKRILAEQERE
ncbi:MAG: hypothetical protein GXO25_04615 [Euryarchaeota archaeon]|nr:hypothetical protein [Euryarchaeota archaeon]